MRCATKAFVFRLTEQVPHATATPPLLIRVGSRDQPQRAELGPFEANMIQRIRPNPREKIRLS